MNQNSEVQAVFNDGRVSGPVFDYLGPFKADQRHGLLGKCVFKSGEFYLGGWKHDMMDTSLQTEQAYTGIPPNFISPLRDAIHV